MRGYELVISNRKNEYYLLRIPMRGYETNRSDANKSSCSSLRIPMRGYELFKIKRSHSKYYRLRIPMRGYELSGNY